MAAASTDSPVGSISARRPVPGRMPRHIHPSRTIRSCFSCNGESIPRSTLRSREREGASDGAPQCVAAESSPHRNRGTRDLVRVRHFGPAGETLRVGRHPDYPWRTKPFSRSSTMLRSRFAKWYALPRAPNSRRRSADNWYIARMLAARAAASPAGPTNPHPASS